MPRFHYRALRPSGGEIAGELVADNERDAALRLQAVGNYPIEITAPSGMSFLRRLSLARPRLSSRDIVLFTRQLAVLIGAGVALDRALTLIVGGRGRARVVRLADELLSAVNRGESLSRACAEHAALPRLYPMVIAAGEVRGDVGDALDRLADMLERSRATSRALFGALIYPISVFVVACLSVSFLLTFVVPRFESLLANLQHEPPWAMRFLLAAASAFQYGALPTALLVAAVSGLVALRWRDAGFRLAVARRILHLPLIGSLVGKIEAERLVFLLGNLIASGVALPAALAATRAAIGNEAFGDALAAAEAGIERGDGVTDSLAAGRLVPNLACELIRVGEETGDLAPMLVKASDILRREVEATTTEMIALITPISIVVLGLVIGGIAFALLGTVMEVYDLAG